jgi:5-carboxymethyl-2-hydroxymuconate isomerase
MPHLILQQSSNVKNPDSKKFFKQAHELLVAKLPTQLSSCKSRLIIVDDYYVADGSPDTAFAHLEVAVLSGRTDDLLAEISKLLFDLLQEHLSTSNKLLDLHLSVEVRSLGHYYKG